MTSDRTQCTDGHTWHALGDDELKDLRSKTRTGRPPGAWVESATRCEACGAVEARISWFGQVHNVPMVPRHEGGPPVIHWPARP